MELLAINNIVFEGKIAKYLEPDNIVVKVEEEEVGRRGVRVLNQKYLVRLKKFRSQIYTKEDKWLYFKKSEVRYIVKELPKALVKFMKKEPLLEEKMKRIRERMYSDPNAGREDISGDIGFEDVHLRDVINGVYQEWRDLRRESPSVIFFSFNFLGWQFAERIF